MSPASIIKMALFAGLAFGLAMGGFFAFFDEIGTAIVVGVAGGAAFGGLMGVAVFIVARRTAANRPALVDERLIKESTANHFINAEACGGWIYLTDRRIHFKTHRANLQNHALTIDLADMVDAAATRTLGLIPNGLVVTTTDGKREKFVLPGRKEWAAAIMAAKHAAAVRSPAGATA